MPLDEEVRAYLAGAGDIGFPDEVRTDPARASAYLAAARSPRPSRTGDPVGRVEDRTLDGGVRLRLYFPEGAGPFPAVLFLHGGGWVLGDLDFQDHVCRRLCRDTAAVLVSVDYRLAPEHPYPAALDDVETAGTWLREHATQLGCDPDALAVFGSSAGGNLAAALTLRDRAAKRRPFALQVLTYPVTDCDLATTSYQACARGYLLEREQMRWYWDQYVPDIERRTEPEAAPLRAGRLAGVPPAIVLTAEFDPLRDEGDAYARRLAAEGVDVVHECVAGQIHGFLGMIGGIRSADEAMTRLCAAVRARLSVAVLHG